MSIKNLPEMPRFPEVVEILKPWPTKRLTHPELPMLKLSEIGTAADGDAAEESTAYRLANPEILCAHQPSTKVGVQRNKLFCVLASIRYHQ